MSTAARAPRRASVPATPARGTEAPRGVLFSDVDGTLLDAHGRLAVSARETARFAARVDLVLVSSRTVAELLELQAALALDAPLIAENGALVAFRPGWRGVRAGVRRRVTGTELQLLALGAPAARIRGIVRRCAARARVPIVEQRETLADGGRALGRTHSVLVRDDSRGGGAWCRFREALRARGLLASRSGHWLTITRGADKGHGVRTLLAEAARAGAGYDVVAAVGNAENDLPLLLAAEHRFVVRDPRHGVDPVLEPIVGARVLAAPGIRGWPEAVRRVLADLRKR